MGSDVGLNPRFGWLKAFTVEGLGPIVAARTIVITATIIINIIIIMIIIIVMIIVIIAIRALLCSGPLLLPVVFCFSSCFSVVTSRLDMTIVIVILNINLLVVLL